MDAIAVVFAASEAGLSNSLGLIMSSFVVPISMPYCLSLNIKASNSKVFCFSGNVADEKRRKKDENEEIISEWLQCKKEEEMKTRFRWIM